jgi:decaprenylphospho-beta-D-erythro-pentofuranosid-2-ulose 2-reductase
MVATPAQAGAHHFQYLLNSRLRGDDLIRKEMMMNNSEQHIVIIGATSGIAEACARRWAGRPAHFFLVARNAARLDTIKSDLQVRGAKAESYVLDANDLSAHAAMIEVAQKALGRIDIVLIAHGTLSDQKACENSADAAVAEVLTNGTSVIALLTHFANVLEAQRSGTLAVISSVAGERGRPSNYVYGAAKAMVTAFCEGLRARMFKVGVHVLVIKPGFVATPMTAALNLPPLLTATPEAAAADIDVAIQRRRDVVFTRWFWRWIMLIIRMIPTPIFKKLSL